MLKTKTGIDIPSVSAKIATQMRNRAITEFGIPPLLMAESCAFSFAMVVRNALGLSAEGGISSCIVNDSFSGLVVLATARHLINAGASVQLIYAGSLDEVSKDMETQLNILGAYGCGLTVWDKLEDAQTIGALLEQGHNCLLGTIKFDSPNDPFEKATNELLNELNTPIYCFDFPTQVDPDTGKSLGSPLYASATVCAGVLVNGIESAEDYTGRIYVCDSVIPRPLYEQLVPDFPVIFSEQPVQAVVRSS